MDHQQLKSKEKIKIYKLLTLINLTILSIMVEFPWLNQSKKLVVDNPQQIPTIVKVSCKTEWQENINNNLINLSYQDLEENSNLKEKKKDHVLTVHQSTKV